MGRDSKIKVDINFHVIFNDLKFRAKGMQRNKIDAKRFLLLKAPKTCSICLFEFNN
jgi:hypothetical protein